MCKKLVVMFGIIAVVLSMGSVYAVPIKPCLTEQEYINAIINKCEAYTPSTASSMTPTQKENCQKEYTSQLCSVRYRGQRVTPGNS